jgi:hypothetical protein
MKIALQLLVCVVIAVSASADITASAAAYANPTLGPATNVGATTIHISNLTIDLASGSAAPVLAGSDPIGIFFSGKGTYTYRSTDPLEASIVVYEAKRVGRDARADKDGVTVRGSFERLYLRGAAIELPKLAAGNPDPQLEQTFKAHLEHLAHALVKPDSHLLLRQRLDAPSSPVAVADFSGSDDDEYVLDPIEHHDERLYALITRPSSVVMSADEWRNAIFPVQVAGQPVGRPRRKFVPPPFLLAGIDYTLIADDRDAAHLTITETIVPRSSPQSAFRFDLLSGVFDERNNYRRLQVASVTDEAGRKLPFHFDHDSILVSTPEKMPVNAPFAIRFEISGNFLYRLGNGNAWQLGTEAWFPQPELNGQFYTVHSVVKTKKPWLPFTPGETVARTEQGDYNVVESAIDKPVQFTVAHAGKYAVFEQKQDNVTIRVATYGGANEATAKQLSDLAFAIIKFYEPFLGAFPFKEFNIIEMNDLGWGQAPPATMFITKEAFSPLLGEENRRYSKGVNQRFAHEIAHQYWGIVAKMGSFEEQWLTESFAEYCSSLVVKQMKGDSGYQNMLNTWRANANAGAFAPIPLANRIVVPWNAIATIINRNALIYDKGAYLLAVLHKQLGDEKFFNALRTIQGRYAWRFLTTDNVEEMFAHFDPSKDYHSFFEKYYWGTEMPVVK